MRFDSPHDIVIVVKVLKTFNKRKFKIISNNS